MRHHGAVTETPGYQDGDQDARPDYESTAIPRAEYITAMVHLYRGELYRATSWRMRLDNTTNWAVLTTAGLLSFSFGDRGSSHWVLLMGLPLIAVFHGFEARRFRLFDIWRGRVRKLEENFYAPIVRRDPVSPESDWGHLFAADLFLPRYKISRWAALRARFVRNYWAVYLILILAWGARLLTLGEEVHGWRGLREQLDDGLLPWWAPLVFVGGFVLSCVALYVLAPRSPGSEVEYWHTEGEREGVEGLELLDV